MEVGYGGMPTILTHAAVGLALGVGASREQLSGRTWTAPAVLPVRPDGDTILHRWMHSVDEIGLAIDSHSLAHRGLTHSFVFAALATLATLPFLGKDARPRMKRALLLFAAA